MCGQCNFRLGHMRLYYLQISLCIHKTVYSAVCCRYTVYLVLQDESCLPSVDGHQAIVSLDFYYILNHLFPVIQYIIYTSLYAFIRLHTHIN